MKNDFEPVVDHKFNLRGDWGAVDCQVLKIQPLRHCPTAGRPMGLRASSPGRSPPTSKGTNLRMEQSGFRADQEQFYQGAKVGWGNFFAKLEQVLSARIDRLTSSYNNTRLNTSTKKAR